MYREIVMLSFMRMHSKAHYTVKMHVLCAQQARLRDAEAAAEAARATAAAQAQSAAERSTTVEAELQVQILILTSVSFKQQAVSAVISYNCFLKYSQVTTAHRY
jgi:hypothetical protein